MSFRYLGRYAVLFGVPLLLAVVEWFHPTGGGRSMFEAVQPQADWWVALHLIQVPLFCLIAFAIWLLVDGLPGRLAWLARISAVCFAVLITVYDSVQGISTGILIRAAHGASPDQVEGYRLAVETLFADPIAGNFSLLAILGIATWAIAVLAAAAALSLAGASFLTVVLLAIAVLGPHNRPTGTLAMVCFFLAAVTLTVTRRNQASPPSNAEVASPPGAKLPGRG